MKATPYKLQLTKGFFADFSQIARMLAYASVSSDRSAGRVPVTETDGAWRAPPRGERTSHCI